MREDVDETWLTYAELGALLGRTANAARMHAQRRGWERRAPNRVGDPARVKVPDGALVRPGATHDVEQSDARTNDTEQAHNQVHDEANVRAIESLREQLVIANKRIDELMADRRRDADERRRLIALLTERGPWWRRWFR
jgi:hypothetical protein